MTNILYLNQVARTAIRAARCRDAMVREYAASGLEYAAASAQASAQRDWAKAVCRALQPDMVMPVLPFAATRESCLRNLLQRLVHRSTAC